MKRVTQADLVSAIRAASVGRADRLIVAIVGPPASGKSTLASLLAGKLDRAAILPMDGFHLDNGTLAAKGLLHRKGAPETFDPAGLDALLERVRRGGAVPVPTFDRETDSVVPDGALIGAATRIVLVEGNYLLLNHPLWRDLHRFWDISVFLETPENTLEDRLVRRWLDYGHSLKDAQARARENDLVNAKTVNRDSAKATFTLAA